MPSLERSSDTNSKRVGRRLAEVHSVPLSAFSSNEGSSQHKRSKEKRRLSQIGTADDTNSLSAIDTFRPFSTRISARYRMRRFVGVMEPLSGQQRHVCSFSTASIYGRTRSNGRGSRPQSHQLAGSPGALLEDLLCSKARTEFMLASSWANVRTHQQQSSH
jgi:hypothetical protein